MLGFLWKITYYPSRLISTSTPSIYKLPELCCSVSIDSCTMCARDMCALVTIETCFISRKSQHLNKQQQNLLYLIHSSISHHYMITCLITLSLEPRWRKLSVFWIPKGHSSELFMYTSYIHDYVYSHPLPSTFNVFITYTKMRSNMTTVLTLN